MCKGFSLGGGAEGREKRGEEVTKLLLAMAHANQSSRGELIAWGGRNRFVRSSSAGVKVAALVLGSGAPACLSSSMLGSVRRGRAWDN
jgi:hypothetical protein